MIGIKRNWWFLPMAMVIPLLLSLLFKFIVLPLVSPPEDHVGVNIRPLSPELKELYDQAVMLWKDGVYTDALIELNKLISVRPDYVNAYIIRGRIFLDNLKQYQNAVVEFKRGLAKDSHNKYLLYNLGLSYYYLGDLNQAIQWNQKAMDQAPDLIIAIYNHAIYYVDYGKKYDDDSYYLKAIELYENVIKRDREFAAAAMFNLAALYARLAKQEKDKNTKDQYVKKAVELLDRSIEKEGLERLRKVTGEIHVQYGEDLEAIRYDSGYSKMIEIWERRFH